MDEVMRLVFRDVSNGVYRCGFARTQDAYERAYAPLFDRLDWLSERLSGRRYLMGESITEADVRLFTTLVRFDPVYPGHFKCNRAKLTEMPVLWAYARDLSQTPGFGDTIDFDHIKRHYYQVHRDINRPASCRSGRTCPVGRPRITARSKAAGRSGMGTPPPPRRRRRGCRPNTGPRRRDVGVRGLAPWPASGPGRAS
jgi:putative glutathione S-transferase